jgi:hypothetical protein
MVFSTVLSAAHAPLYLVVSECPPFCPSTLIGLTARDLTDRALRDFRIPPGPISWPVPTDSSAQSS